MAKAKKVQLFQTISRAELSERIPRVPGAFHFALPFPADEDIDWSEYFAGIKPRAFLVARYPETTTEDDGEGGTTTVPHPKAGLIYPLNLGDDNPNLEADKANFLGVVIDGTDYEKDLNITVTLAAGIPLKFLQGDLASESEVVDPLVVEAAQELGFKIFSQNIFWNFIQ